MKIGIEKVTNDKKYFSEEILMYLTEEDAGSKSDSFDILSPGELKIVQMLLNEKKQPNTRRFISGFMNCGYI